MRAFAILVLLLAVPILAEEAGSQSVGPTAPVVDHAVICTGVVNRAPVGAGEAFDAAVGALWCFTRISGVEGESTITHTWYMGEHKVHEQPLAVRGPSWRTWSMKSIPPDWKGPWHVDIVVADGTVVTTVAFTVQ
ncbi:DUF2914 domain-containing protein [Candidatus Fermentibacteria bacterium]|nr:DUF2914 domain-containing protein [Candidatus Fermentibacteria bacterium]